MIGAVIWMSSNWGRRRSWDSCHRSNGWRTGPVGMGTLHAGPSWCLTTSTTSTCSPCTSTNLKKVYQLNQEWIKSTLLLKLPKDCAKKFSSLKNPLNLILKLFNHNSDIRFIFTKYNDQIRQTGDQLLKNTSTYNVSVV